MNFASHNSFRVPGAADAPEQLYALFGGATTHHGTYDPDPTKMVKGENGKLKPRCRTEKEPPTLAHWAQHIAGKRPVGIAPLREDDQCVWGAIDVDQYDLEPPHFVQEVKRKAPKLVPCRSKSGGVQLYLILAEPVPAAKVRAALRAIAAQLGYDAEIFPKQEHSSETSYSNWLNMPFQRQGDRALRHQAQWACHDLG